MCTYKIKEGYKYNFNNEYVEIIKLKFPHVDYINIYTNETKTVELLEFVKNSEFISE